MGQDSARFHERAAQEAAFRARWDNPSSARTAIRIAAWASLETLRRLQHALAQPAFVFTAVSSLASLEERLKADGIDVLVLEPGFADDASLRDEQSLLSLCRRFAHVPIVAITRFNADALHSARAFLRAESTELVIAGWDDSPTKLASVAAEAYSFALESRMMSRLAPQLRLLPVSLQSSIANLFRDPLRFPTTASLARESGVSHRGMDRAFERVGLASAKSILRAAAALRAWRLLKHARVADILASMHYGSERRFHRDLRYATGTTPRSLRAISSTDELLELVWQRLQRDGFATTTRAPELER